MAITLKINANRRNAINLLPTHATLRPQDLMTSGPYDLKSGIFKPSRRGPFAPDALWNKHRS
jgi:hypothetical protein